MGRADASLKFERIVPRMNAKTNLKHRKVQKLVAPKLRVKKETLDNWDMWERLHDPRNFKHELREMPVTR